jgi:hypothetical protein
MFVEGTGFSLRLGKQEPWGGGKGEGRAHTLGP